MMSILKTKIQIHNENVLYCTNFNNNLVQTVYISLNIFTTVYVKVMMAKGKAIGYSQ